MAGYEFEIITDSRFGPNTMERLFILTNRLDALSLPGVKFTRGAPRKLVSEDGEYTVQWRKWYRVEKDRSMTWDQVFHAINSCGYSPRYSRVR